LDLAEVENAVGAFDLNDEISARRHFGDARLEHTASDWDDAWKLAADVVVPH